MTITIIIFGFLFFVCISLIYKINKKYITILKDNILKEQKINDLINNINDKSKINDSLKTEFKNIASKILEEKNEIIINSNKISLENVMAPFKTKIDEFKNKIDKLHIYEAEKMSAFQKELEKLMILNKHVSEDANNLTNALKSENKIHGIWGEINLERIFEYIGMIKGINYTAQKQFKTNEGKNKIPDYIINLPEKKHVIIDVKTSLIAYTKYYNSQNETEKKHYLKEHSISMKRHVDNLVKKDYIELDSINKPEYVLMFVPIENAICLALMDNPNLISYAFTQNIVIVTPSTLLITLKTIKYIWHTKDQEKNVFEISKQGGYLYDKFITFIQTLVETEKKISEAKTKIHEAIKKLSNSDKKGDSILERAKKLKELGVITKKNLPKEFLDN
jgi:DNA recombination protein RmuC